MFPSLRRKKGWEKTDKSLNKHQSLQIIMFEDGSAYAKIDKELDMQNNPIPKCPSHSTKNIGHNSRNPDPKWIKTVSKRHTKRIASRHLWETSLEESIPGSNLYLPKPQKSCRHGNMPHKAPSGSNVKPQNLVVDSLHLLLTEMTIREETRQSN